MSSFYTSESKCMHNLPLITYLMVYQILRKSSILFLNIFLLHAESTFQLSINFPLV